MNKKEISYALILITTIIGWFYFRLDQIKTYEQYYPEFYNETTKEWVKPKVYMTTVDFRPVEYRENINKTSTRDRLLEYARTWRHMNIIKQKQRYDREEDLELSAWPIANKQKCQNQLKFIADEVRKLGHRNLTIQRGIEVMNLNNYLESFGQPEYGLYNQRPYWIGSQIACESTKLAEESEKSLGARGDRLIENRYCLGHGRFKDWPNHIIWGATINIGLCLPETCDTSSFEENKDEIDFLMKFNWPNLEKEAIILDDMFCLPDERSPIRQIPWQGKLIIYTFSIWASIVILSSIVYESFSSRTRENNSNQYNKWMHLWKIFTIQNGFERLVSPAKIQSTNSKLIDKTRKVDLRPLDFLKAIMAITVVLGHSNMMTIFWSRPTAENYFGELVRFSFSLGRLNDTFFIIFGLLITTKVLSQKKVRQNLDQLTIWFGIYWQIIWRVFPLFFITYWLNRSVAPYLSNGPWWDYGLGNSFKTICNTEPWWKSIPYFGNWGVQALPHCNVPSWFMIAYVQLGLICPLLIYIIDRLPNYSTRFFLVIITFIVSLMHTAIKLANQQVYDKDTTIPFGFFTVIFVDKYEPSGYFDSLGRLGCVAIGCLVGKILHQYKTNNDNGSHHITDIDQEVNNKQQQQNIVSNYKLPYWLTSTTTLTLSILCHIIIACLPSIAHHYEKIAGYPADFNIVLALNTVGLFGWPFANSVFLVNIVTKWRNADWVRFMSHRGWSCFNELGLGISLLHFEAIIFATSSNETANNHDFMFNIVANFTFALTVAILGSIPLYVLVQAPIDEISKLRRTHKQHHSKSK